jgi:hypothetical protein
MRPVRSMQAHRHYPARSMALDDEIAWSSRRGPGSGPLGVEDRDRLAWPKAIAVTALISSVLWIGIAGLVHLTFG